MTNASRIQLGPDASGYDKGRNTHGRWRCGHHQASAPETTKPIPSALIVRHDADRLAFALTSGPAAIFLAEEIAEYLWTREALNEEWPVNLRAWLHDETNLWTGAPRSAARTGFICGRLERNLPGGRLYLAWLGMSGVRLQDRSGNDITLDTVIGEDEGWTPERGPEPEGLGLHAYRGSLFGLDRLSVLSLGAETMRDDLPDMSSIDLEEALADWAEESEYDLAIFDLRINPVLTAPTRVVVNYRWVSSDLCLLFWQTSPNATAYRIMESETPDFTTEVMVAEMTDGRQTQYKLSPPAGSTHYYRVVPLNQGVPGTPSEPICPTPLVLSAPIMQPVEWDRDGGYVLRWSPVEQATSYEVQTSSSMEYDPYESEIIYRGDIAEVNLPPNTPPNRVYRVRAINVLYAPQNPSAWSHPRRAPAKLETPHFTTVTHDRIEWDHVSGAQQYAVRVTAAGEDDGTGDDIFTREPSVRAADLPATYRVRAYRHPTDHRTASEWSEPVTLAPKERAIPASRINTRTLTPLLLGAAMVALIVGAALGISGIEAYKRANATATRTPLPEAAVEGTQDAVTAAAKYATQVEILGTRVRSTDIAFQIATMTATVWTATPTVTITPSPTDTPNLTTTVQAALTQAALAWTATPTSTYTPTPTNTSSPTITLTPTNTPDIDATIDMIFTQEAAARTATPTASLTPTATDTLAPTNTPNMTETVAAALTEAAGGWTATPTATRTSTPLPTTTPVPDIAATIAAYVENGCFIHSVPVGGLPVYAGPLNTAVILKEKVPVLAEVMGQITLTSGAEHTRATWIRVRLVNETPIIDGWVRVPDGTEPTTLYSGPNCP